MNWMKGFVPLLALAIVSCRVPDDGTELDAVSCSSMSGSVSSSGTTISCTGCVNQFPERMADNSLSSYARLYTPNGSQDTSYQITPSGSTTYAAGSRVGAFISLVGGAASPNAITIRTFNGSTPVQVVSGPSLTITPTNGKTSATSFVGFKSTAPFTRMDIRFNTVSESEYLIHEVCGHAVVPED